MGLEGIVSKLADARYVTLRVPLGAWNRNLGERLRDILDSHRGDCQVTFDFERVGLYTVSVAASAAFRVRPDPSFKGAVEALLGTGCLVLARQQDPSLRAAETAH